MDDRALDKHRIAKNTILLYLRMLFVIGVGLYTTRVVLHTLGESDYGIYNVVGGIVAMLTFLNTAMTGASQRYISFELGREEPGRLNKVFCTSVNIHVLISLIIFVFAETIGLWFVNAKLNIPEERMLTANWVYQFSILTFMLTVWSVPYNSCIVAHEHMKAFAYIGMVETLMKLGIVYLLQQGNYDRLFLYAVLVLAVAVVVQVLYVLYCRRHFAESVYRLSFDAKLFREMFSFAGWSMLGNLGFSFKDSISNIILNIFFGTAVNAARGVAMQVNSVIVRFSGTFTMALNPQITKQYAVGETAQTLSLVYSGARFSFYLMMLVAVPFLINQDYILELWLDEVPEYTGIFIILTLLASLLYTMSGPLSTALYATGNIKVFQIGICLLMLSELPIAYLLLSVGYPPYYAMLPTLATYSVAIFYRLYLLKRYVRLCDFRLFITTVLLRCMGIFVVCYGTSYCLTVWLKECMDNGLSVAFASTVSSVCLMIAVVYSLGISDMERESIHSQLRKYLHRG